MIDNFFNSDVIMSSLLKKLSVSIKIHVVKQTQKQTQSVWPVSKLSTESVGSRRELVANCVHTADAVRIGHNGEWGMGKPIPELRDVTRLMGSHGFTCHPTQVNAPRLNHSQ